MNNQGNQVISCSYCNHEIFRNPTDNKFYHVNRLNDESCYNQTKNGVCGCEIAAFDPEVSMPEKSGLAQRIAERVAPKKNQSLQNRGIPELIDERNPIPPVPAPEPVKESPVDTVLSYLLETKNYDVASSILVLRLAENTLLNQLLEQRQANKP